MIFNRRGWLGDERQIDDEKLLHMGHRSLSTIRILDIFW